MDDQWLRNSSLFCMHKRSTNRECLMQYNYNDTMVSNQLVNQIWIKVLNEV